MTISWVPRLTTSAIVAVTPTISTSPAYTSGDQLGGIQTIAINSSLLRMDSNSNMGSNIPFGTATLTEVTVLDKGKQSASIDLWFFAASPTIASTDNAAFDLTDANLIVATGGLPITLGYTNVATYSTSSSNAIATQANVNLSLGSTTASSLYSVAVIRSAVTYASTTDLVFLYKFIID